MSDDLYEKTGVIYCHFCVENKKAYIGKTIRKVKERSGSDGSGYIRRNEKSVFSRTIKKYGWENFETRIIGVYSVDKLDDAEKMWIAIYGTKCPKGLNMTEGGEGTTGRKATAKMMRVWNTKNDKLKKQTYQYAKSGELINQFSCMKEAARQTKIDYRNLSACARGMVPTVGGFVWSYSELSKEEIKNRLKKTHRFVALVDSQGNVIKRFKTSVDAAKYLGISSGSVYRILKGKIVFDNLPGVLIYG